MKPGNAHLFAMTASAIQDRETESEKEACEGGKEMYCMKRYRACTSESRDMVGESVSRYVYHFILLEK